MSSFLQKIDPSEVHEDVEGEYSSGSSDGFDFNFDDSNSYDGGNDEDNNEKDYEDDDEDGYLSIESSLSSQLEISHHRRRSSGGNLSSSLSAPPGFIVFNLPPPLPPPRGGPKNMIASLPCSMNSSQSGQILMKGSKTRFSLQPEISLPRSKSCGDGRSSAPPDEFDILSKRRSPHDSKVEANGSRDHHRQETDGKRSDGYDHSLNEVADGKIEIKELRGDTISDPNAKEESFKCRAFCMSLPRLSKGKHVGSRSNRKHEKEGSCTISRAVSLEKFECGSWTSSWILDGDEEEECYDLPLELTVNDDVNDTNSPVKTAFVFDQKGVLKKSNSSLTPKSPVRHVRFNTSTQASVPPSPSKIYVSSRLGKVRDDFDAYLQAQIS